MDMKFCRRCGSVLEHAEENVYKCVQGHVIFANASPAVGMFFINESKEVLLAVRARNPAKGKLTLPGGFCCSNETLEAALGREIQEELGVSEAQYTGPTYLLSDNHSYEYSGETMQVIVATYYSQLQGQVQPGDDVAAVRWLRYEAVPRDQLAFSVVGRGLDRLRQLGLI